MSIIIDSTAVNTTNAVDALNTNTTTAPLNPASNAEVATMPNPSASSDNVSASAIKAISAQMAVNAQSASDAERKNAGVISPVTGLTARQLEEANALPPGAGAHMTALIKRGMPPAEALGSTTTGELGVSSGDSIVNNTSKQVSIIQSVIAGSADKLKSAGILTGNENSLQSSGPIMAAAAMGVSAVTNLFSNGGTSTSALSSINGNTITGALGSLKDNLAGGKLAGSLSDSLSGAAGGLKTSLAAIGAGATGLKSTMESAFSAVESSFGSLKGGVKNVLGKVTESTTEASPSTKAASSYDSAKAEYDAAEEEYYAAKRDYRNSGDAADLERANKAEADMTAAKQKISKASKAFASSAVSAVTGLTASLPTSLTSGLNALPGGAGALFATVGKATGGISSSISGLGAGDLLSKASSLGGDLVNNTTKQLTSSLSSATGIAAGLSPDKLKAMAGGAMAQIQASLSAIPSADGLMSPILAEGTNTFAAVKAKAGQLLGDVRIPNPLNSMSSEEPINTANIDKIAEKQKTAYAELQNAVNDVRANELSLASVVETYGDTPGQESKVSAARAKLDAALAALSIAQDKYSASQSSTTA
jgi:hypothetical protein